MQPHTPPARSRTPVAEEVVARAARLSPELWALRGSAGLCTEDTAWDLAAAEARRPRRGALLCREATRCGKMLTPASNLRSRR